MSIVIKSIVEQFSSWRDENKTLLEEADDSMKSYYRRKFHAYNNVVAYLEKLISGLIGIV